LGAKSESGRNGSRVGNGVVTVEEPELVELGLGACANIIQPVKKLRMLVTVIQNRRPNFRSFISPRKLLIDKDATVVSYPDQVALL